MLHILPVLHRTATNPENLAAEWLVGESGQTIRKPLCHELVKLMDTLVAGDTPLPAMHE